MSFGSRLSKCRKAHKLGQAELAELTGVTRSFISKLERGSKAPSRQFVARLQGAIALSSSELSELKKAAAYSRRRIFLGHHLDAERVEIANVFIERLASLKCAPLWALLELLSTETPRRTDM